MAPFSEALYESNEEPLHLVLDEADLWAPQRPIKGWESLLGHIEEIVRRGRVRGFIPWLITQRPAVVHKDVLSQADILIAMKLTSSQDRDAIGARIEGQADRQQASAFWPISRNCKPARAMFGPRVTPSLNASPFRRSAPSTARVRQSAASAWRPRARSPRSILPRSPLRLPPSRVPKSPRVINQPKIAAIGLSSKSSSRPPLRVSPVSSRKTVN